MKSKLSPTALKQKSKETPSAVHQFDDLPDTALISITNAGIVAGRSRCSIYRHVKAGELTIVRVGKSSRLIVGQVRRLIGGTGSDLIEPPKLAASVKRRSAIAAA